MKKLFWRAGEVLKHGVNRFAEALFSSPTFLARSGTTDILGALRDEARADARRRMEDP